MKLEEIKDIRIEDFDYPLPDERIAKHPLADRDSCKLLRYADGQTTHHIFSELPDLLPENALLVMNNTRVINARMEFHRASGARIEIFLLEPLEPRDYAQAFQSRRRCTWQCLVGNLKKWKEDYLEKTLDVDGRKVTLRAIKTPPSGGRGADPLGGRGVTHAIKFEWDDEQVTFASIVEAAGNIPIPPYLNRKSEESDSTDYQTVYSRIQGSVAAPTAGLHFTSELLESLRAKGIETREVTLHVGAGTFQPVKSEEIGEHPMHRETFEVDLQLVRELRQALETGRPVIAVGTTTVRTLESLPLLFKGEESRVKSEVGQWEAYSDEALATDTVESLKALEQYMEKEGFETLQAATSIMIAPGFKWRIVSGMVTNFHQPQSTLLLLVSSLLDGDNLTDPAWRRIYREALDHGYRFLSYGDACLFMAPQPPKGGVAEWVKTPPSGGGGATNIDIPGSKSIAARALVCRLLGGHDTLLTNLPDCGDTRGMLRLTEAIRQSKSEESRVKSEESRVKSEESRVKSEESRVKSQTTTVDIGEGGTTLRFGMAACASIPGLDITLTGSPRLMERPHDTLINALRDMGADITLVDAEGNPVDDSKRAAGILIRGHELSGGTIRLDGSVSSQYISALMLSAPTWKADTTFILEGNIVSRPYIEMTAGVMRAFGADVSLKSEGSRVKSEESRVKSEESRVKSEESFEVLVKATGYAQCARYDIEGDWSGASYFFELRVIAKALGLDLPDFTMPSLKAPAESLQGDSRIAAIFADASRHFCSPFRGLGGFSLNLNDAPDLVPALAVGLCVAGIPFRIEGVAHLRHKETDRMAAIATELRRLGFVIQTGEDSMAWDGSRCEPEAEPLIRTYQDHRMAMAFAPARLAVPTLRIEDPTVVEKSFPDYWQELDKIMISDKL